MFRELLIEQELPFRWRHGWQKVHWIKKRVLWDLVVLNVGFLSCVYVTLESQEGLLPCAHAMLTLLE
jgi:hypothetical protein